jgi:hypothetical protein
MTTSTYQSKSSNWIRVVVVALLLPEASPGRAPCTTRPDSGLGRILPDAALRSCRENRTRFP